MDSRETPRVAVHLDVLVNFGCLGLIKGRSRDISAHGMYVETLVPYALPDNERVELSFSTLSTDLGLEAHQLGAWVVRSSEHGVGLRFDQRLTTAIRRMLDTPGA